MIFRIIAALILGIAIGININSILHKKNRSRVEMLEDLITIYEVHETELREKINYYKNGMNETLKQNIELQRRLNNGNSRRI